MNVRKFIAATTRDALRKVKETLGPDAIILSNRAIPGGVEIMAVAARDMEMIVPIPEPEAAAPRQREPICRVRRGEAGACGAAAVTDAAGCRANSRAAGCPAAVPAAAGRQPRDRSPPLAARALPPLDLHHGQPARMHQARGGSGSGGGDRRDSLCAGSSSSSSPASPGGSPRVPSRSRPRCCGRCSTPVSRRDSRASCWLTCRTISTPGRPWAGSRVGPTVGLLTINSETDIVDRGGVYALVGPTGVGKTTTTAKLAARCVLRHGARKLALVTTDGYRIGAHEQLRIYGRILGVSVHLARDAEDLRTTLTGSPAQTHGADRHDGHEPARSPGQRTGGDVRRQQGQVAVASLGDEPAAIRSMMSSVPTAACISLVAF
jgi:flagellar biosynthesis protein FlhF